MNHHVCKGLLISAGAQTLFKRLTKHFSHKIPVHIQGESAVISFEEGDCELILEEPSLTFHCQSAGFFELNEILKTMDRHVDQFTKSSPAAIQWNKT